MRRSDRFDRTSLGASLAVHAGVVVVALWSSTSAARPAPAGFVSYQIELVSPPPVRGDVDQTSQDQLVVETPNPAPLQEEKPAGTVVEEKPPSRASQQRPAPVSDPLAEVGEERRPGTSTTATDTAGPGGAGINVRMEGLRRDYPQYYLNIIAQIQRCFRWQQGGRWETTVYFVIHRDGTVSDLDFAKRSGNPSFDFEAMGAVDCAGKGRFGPLPEDLPYDVLPVQFRFQPQGAIREDASAAAAHTTPGETAGEP